MRALRTADSRPPGEHQPPTFWGLDKKKRVWWHSGKHLNYLLTLTHRSPHLPHFIISPRASALTFKTILNVVKSKCSTVAAFEGRLTYTIRICISAFTIHTPAYLMPATTTRMRPSTSDPPNNQLTITWYRKSLGLPASKPHNSFSYRSNVIDCRQCLAFAFPFLLTLVFRLWYKQPKKKKENSGKAPLWPFNPTPCPPKKGVHLWNSSHAQGRHLRHLVSNLAHLVRIFSRGIRGEQLPFWGHGLGH